MDYFKDYFHGSSGALIENRTPSDSDGTALTGEKWRPGGSAVQFLSGSGTARSEYDPFGQSIYYADSARPIDRNYNVEHVIANLNGGSAGPVLCYDPKIGDYYYTEIGFSGFPNPSLRIIVVKDGVGAQIGLVGGTDNSFPVVNNQSYRIKSSVSELGGVIHLKVEFATGAGSLSTVWDADITDPNFQLPEIGFPGIGAKGANGSFTDSFIASYSPGGAVDPTTNVGRFIYVGDSNAEFASTPGKTTIPNLIARKLETDQAFDAVFPLNRGLSGTTTANWTTTPQFYQHNLSAAATNASITGTTLCVIGLGTNDSKVSEGISSDTYKTNILSIIAAMKNAGVQKFLLVSPAAVNEATAGSDWTGSNARIAGYASKLAEIALADSTCTHFDGLRTFFLANQGATYLNSDGIHWALASQGYQIGRDLLAGAIGPLMRALYPVPQSGGNGLTEEQALQLTAIADGISEITAVLGGLNVPTAAQIAAEVVAKSEIQTLLLPFRATQKKTDASIEYRVGGTLIATQSAAMNDSGEITLGPVVNV